MTIPFVCSHFAPRDDYKCRRSFFDTPRSFINGQIDCYLHTATPFNTRLNASSKTDIVSYLDGSAVHIEVHARTAHLLPLIEAQLAIRAALYRFLREILTLYNAPAACARHFIYASSRRRVFRQ